MAYIICESGEGDRRRNCTRRGDLTNQAKASIIILELETREVSPSIIEME